MTNRRCQQCGKKIGVFPFGSRPGDCFCTAKCQELAEIVRESKN